jgi:hypothetical protein
LESALPHDNSVVVDSQAAAWAVRKCRCGTSEKTDRLYRNLKDWVTLDELDQEIHFVKENVVISRDSRSSEKFMHGIKVLMAKNYIDNLSEETRKGMLEKALKEFTLLTLHSVTSMSCAMGNDTSNQIRSSSP